MLNKKFLGIVISAVTSASVMMLGGSFIYAEEETHTHSEKALAPEHPTVELPMCPTCKDVREPGERKDTCSNAHGLPGLQKRDRRTRCSPL